MTLWRPTLTPPHRLGRDVFKPQVILAALAAVTAAAAAPLLASQLPPAQVLPALSLAALACAGLAALVAWWLGALRQGGHVMLWDVAGVFAFIGFAAAMFSDPEQVMHLFDRTAMPR
jgi:hypothetical protein